LTASTCFMSSCYREKTPSYDFYHTVLHKTNNLGLTVISQL
jgi:hypothetical protein